MKIVKNKKIDAGFTLIETVIYIALLGMIIGSGVVAAYHMIEENNRLRGQIIIAEEGNFLLRKIDSVFTGAGIIYLPTAGATGQVLRLGNNGTLFRFELNSGILMIKKDSGDLVSLNSDNTTLTNLIFEHIPSNSTKPAGVRVSFLLNGISFQLTKYLRL